jgi:hypothetical protein
MLIAITHTAITAIANISAFIVKRGIGSHSTNMEAIELLRSQSLAKRKAEILKANVSTKRPYRMSLRRLTRLTNGQQEPALSYGYASLVRSLV